MRFVGYGGRGVIRDWQGIRNINNAPQFYELALPDDPSCLWQQNSYEPDAIAICLGTNDFNQGVPDENEFVNAYVEFIRKIRRDSPNARIFLLDSPMLDDAAGKVPKADRAARLHSGNCRTGKQSPGSTRLSQPLCRHSRQRPSDPR